MPLVCINELTTPWQSLRLLLENSSNMGIAVQSNTKGINGKECISIKTAQRSQPE